MKKILLLILTLLTAVSTRAQIINEEPIWQLGGGGKVMVSSIVKAPVTSDGDVAGRPTDLVINHHQ